MNTRIGLLRSLMVSAVMAFLAQTAGHAQPFWSTLAGGGGTSAGGAFAIGSTIGQPIVGQAAGGSYAVLGGFWAGAGNTLRLHYAWQGFSLTTSWQGAGFVLQCADNITGPWQDVSTGITTDGLNFSVTVSMSAPKRFYRLRR